LYSWTCIYKRIIIRGSNVSFTKEAEGRDEFDNSSEDGVSVVLVDAFAILFELLITVTATIGTKRAAIKRVLTSKLILSIICIHYYDLKIGIM
jgi:hypothetical protein